MRRMHLAAAEFGTKEDRIIAVAMKDVKIPEGLQARLLSGLRRRLLVNGGPGPCVIRVGRSRRRCC